MSSFIPRTILRFAVVALLAGVFAGLSLPAEAHKRHRSAYVVGTHFPYVSGYRYHPAGYWYVTRRSHCRYPARYYRYQPHVGYVYYGPRYGYYRYPQVRHYHARDYGYDGYYRPRRHSSYLYHYEPRNRGIFTHRGHGLSITIY